MISKKTSSKIQPKKPRASKPKTNSTNKQNKFIQKLKSFIAKPTNIFILATIATFSISAGFLLTKSFSKQSQASATKAALPSEVLPYMIPSNIAKLNKATLTIDPNKGSNQLQLVGSVTKDYIKYLNNQKTVTVTCVGYAKNSSQKIKRQVVRGYPITLNPTNPTSSNTANPTTLGQFSVNVPYNLAPEDCVSVYYVIDSKIPNNIYTFRSGNLAPEIVKIRKIENTSQSSKGFQINISPSTPGQQGYSVNIVPSNNPSSNNLNTNNTSNSANNATNNSTNNRQASQVILQTQGSLTATTGLGYLSQLGILGGNNKDYYVWRVVGNYPVTTSGKAMSKGSLRMNCIDSQGNKVPLLSLIGNAVKDEAYAFFGDSSSTFTAYFLTNSNQPCTFSGDFSTPEGNVYQLNF